MKEMFENWSETKEALLEGLDADKRAVTGTLLENEMKYLTESAAAGSVGAHDIAGFRKIMIPMIRRIIPGTIATELVGVQPMQGPVGLVYTMRYKHVEAVTQPATGFYPSTGSIAAGDEMFGNNPALRQFYSGSTGVDQPAGTSGLGSVANSEANIGPGAAGGAWPSSLDAAATGGAGARGPLHGGSGSFIEGSGGRKVSLEVVSQAVEAGSRKLQAGWSIEAMQDLQSQHGLDLEAELTKVMSAEIVQEIDSEILSDLMALAGTTSAFDLANYGSPAGFQPAFLGDKMANLGVHINFVCNEIARKTRRGAGNWIVVSPMTVSVLQSAAKSVFAPAVSGSFKGPNNTMLVGTLNGTIKVYSYLWNQNSALGITGGAGADTILVGYKGGNGETDVGYFYCPYIPLMSSGVVINPVTFQPVVSLMTRYGKATFVSTVTSLGNSADYYGKISVANINIA